jgi:Rod binding domain-containing protein
MKPAGLNPIGPSHNLRGMFEAAQGRSAGPLTSSKELTEREAFQAAVAGTFFKMMLKSLHKMHGKPAYFYGGQAEEMFQSQMNEQLAQDFARTHGAPLTDALYEASVRNRIQPAEAGSF